MKKKWLIILAIAAVAVIAAAAVLVVNLLSPEPPNYKFPEFVDSYQTAKSYTSQDSNVVFDGMLDDAAWSNQRWLEVSHVTESSIGVKMTSYFGEDGLYMAFDVSDYGVYFDEKRDAAYNSGIQLYISSMNGAKNITDHGYEISLTAGGQVKLKKYTGSMYELYLGRAYCEAVVKGKMNSDEARGYTMEAYIDYDLLGENYKQVYANVAIVRAMSETGTERQWYSFGQNDRGAAWTRAETWWTFDAAGLLAHDVTFNTGVNGTIEGKPYVPAGDDYTFCVVANDGYYAKSVKVNQQEMLSELYYMDGKTYCTVEMVHEDLNIQVEYVQLPQQTISVIGKVETAGGVISGARLWAVMNGYSQSLRVGTDGSYTAQIPAMEGIMLFADAEGYVPKAVLAKEGKNNLTLEKMYFGKNETVDRNSTEMTLWDLNRLYQGRVRMKASQYAMELVNSQVYGKSVYASTTLKTDVESGVDTRAGFTFYVDKDLSVFVALTMNGEVNQYNPTGDINCTVQVISEYKGERIWGSGGITVAIEDQHTIMDLASGAGVPFAVHYNKGEFDVWVADQQICYGVYPKDANGNNRLNENTAVAVGLQCWSTRAVYEDLRFDGNYPARLNPSAPDWDLSKLKQGIAVSESDKNWSSAILKNKFYSTLSMTANVPLEGKSGQDLRAGFLLRNSQGKEVFIALTANGEKNKNNPDGDLYYTVQIISGGYASWKVDGKLTDTRDWAELHSLIKSGGVPMDIYIENGKLTVGVNGYVVAENVVPLDQNGKPILSGNVAVTPGLATARTALTFSNVSYGTKKPTLKDPSLRDWDVSKAEQGIYSRTSEGGFASLFLTEQYEKNVCISGKLPLIAQNGKDIRAGLVFRNEKGVEVFVSLTANGEKNNNNPNGDLYYTVQVISGGYASWKVQGSIVDIRTWDELHSLAANGGIPFVAYMENGKLTIGVNGYEIAKDVIPVNTDGTPILGQNTAVKAGLATAAQPLTYTDVEVVEVAPELQDSDLRGWDLSQLDHGLVSRELKATKDAVMLQDTLRSQYYMTSRIEFAPAAEDVRVGYRFSDAEGNRIFVALLRTADGSYAVQMIATPKSGGFFWTWNYKLNNITNMPEGGLPFGVAYDKGVFDIWVNDSKIGNDIVPKIDGEAVFAPEDTVCIGLECWSTTAIFRDLGIYNVNDEPQSPITSTEKEITDGYAESDKYVVLSARIRSLTAVTHDWNSNVILSVSGKDNWQNYAFQIVYGTASNKNLVKLNNNRGYDGKNILQEQWYNNEKLENLFGETGFEVKIVRMDTMVYLLADMGDGYERIGVMQLPENAPTQLKLYAPKMDVRLNRVHVETGKEAAEKALQGDAPDVLINSKGAAPTVIPGDYTNANYAVLEANIKALDAITYDWGSNIIVSVSGSARWADNYDMQILYGKSATQNLVKLQKATTTVDGIQIPQEQWVNNAGFEKPFTDDGMNIKMIRLNTWVYLLVDMGSGYTLVGKLAIPETAVTEFSVYNSKTAVQISNFSVKTGQDAALAALDGIDLKVDQLAKAFAVPVDGTQWTLEGKLSIADFAAGADYRFTVSSNKSDWRRMTVAYINGQSKWRGQSVAQISGSWASADIPGADTLTGSGLWVRFVRDGATLSLYVSADRENWTYIQNCDNCGTQNGVVYIFEANGDFSPVLADMTIRAGLPQSGTEEEPKPGDQPEIVARKVESITLKDLPDQIMYRLGETFRIIDASYEVRYDNGDVEFGTITQDMCSDVDMTQSGIQTVYVDVCHDGYKARLEFCIEILGDPEKYDPTVS